MKVYGTILHGPGGQYRAVVQAPSKKAAAAAFGMTMHHMNGFSSITGNPAELEAASRNPGAVFWVPIREQYRSARAYVQRAAQVDQSPSGSRPERA